MELRRGSAQVEAKRSEQLLEFDVMASVRMMRRDLQTHGAILPETRKQVFDEEMSFSAEAIDARLNKLFTYEFEDDELISNGMTRFSAMLRDGEEAARQAYVEDPRSAFSYRRAKHDRRQGTILKEMMTSSHVNTLVEFVPYPEEAHQQYGADFVADKGYNPNRRLAFMRIYHRVSDRQLDCHVISIDNSNLAAFRSVADTLEIDIPEDARSDDFIAHSALAQFATEDISGLKHHCVSQYDQALSREEGGHYFQGRPQQEQVVEAWDFVVSQRDLVGYFMDKLEKLALSPQPLSDLERDKKVLNISLWSALSSRLKQSSYVGSIPDTYTSYSEQRIAQEMNDALIHAVARHGKTIGCGGEIALNDLLEANIGEAVDAAVGGDEFDGKCVTCPFCKEMVDAIVTTSHIKCPQCKASVKR